MTYKTSLKLNENIVAVLCYIGVWMTGILFLLIEPDNKFVRFHALQSIIVFLPLSIIVFMLGWIPYYGWLLADLAGFFAVFVQLVLIIMAWRGSKFKLPIIGKKAYDYIYK
ncbi:MAG: hypothetical protein K8R64_08515 [Methanosarcinaceae archaeon]|nr:hypothetical protein [Methanosarcinaceae archaeon]